MSSTKDIREITDAIVRLSDEIHHVAYGTKKENGSIERISLSLDNAADKVADGLHDVAAAIRALTEEISHQ